jgi:hypothetical protein
MSATPEQLAALRPSEAQLRVLVGQAFELRDTPYLRDACDAIVDAWDRRHVTDAERRPTLAELVALMRDPKP